MNGNGHYHSAVSVVLTDQSSWDSIEKIATMIYANTEATLALVHEQRTANILAAQATPDWLNDARIRMGAEPFPPGTRPVDQRCEKHLMDGRNEIRCWGRKDHEGDCT